jgi:uncharacterized protein YrrD
VVAMEEIGRAISREVPFLQSLTLDTSTFSLHQRCGTVRIGDVLQVFEDSVLYTTSYDAKCVLLDSLYPTLYFKTIYTRYHILASAQIVETYLTESDL